jgi:hypothetical protein
MRRRELAFAVLSTTVWSACVQKRSSVFEKEFYAVQRVIPAESHGQCSEKPVRISLGYSASCAFELSGDIRHTRKVISDGVPPTYSMLRQEGSSVLYVRDFGNDNYSLTFTFSPVAPERTRIEMNLKSAAN